MRYGATALLMIVGLAAITLCFVGDHADADVEQGDFVYSVSGNEAVIVGYVGTSSEAFIPDHVTIDGKRYPVVGIGPGTFTDVTSLRSLVIGKNIRTIQDGAFAGCTNLRSVDNMSPLTIEPGSDDNGGVASHARFVRNDCHLLTVQFTYKGTLLHVYKCCMQTGDIKIINVTDYKELRGYYGIKSIVMGDGDLTKGLEIIPIVYTLTYNTIDTTVKVTYPYGAPIVPFTPSDDRFVSWDPVLPDTMPSNDLTVNAVYSTAFNDVVWVIDGKEIDRARYGSGDVVPARSPFVDNMMVDWSVGEFIMPNEEVCVEAVSYAVINGDSVALEAHESLSVSHDFIRALIDSGISLDISLDAASIAAHPELLEAIGPGDMTVSANVMDNTQLSEAQQSIAKDSIVVSLLMDVDGKNVHIFNGATATVSIPRPAGYPESCTIYYLAWNGTYQEMETVYDEATDSFVFNTGHFSEYAIKEKEDNEVSNTMQILVLIVVGCIAVIGLVFYNRRLKP